MKLTKAQTKWVDWALGGMFDYLSEEDCDYGEADLPTLQGNHLELAGASDSAIEDLLWRLEQQAPDMDEPGEPVRSTSAINAAKRIREILCTATL